MKEWRVTVTFIRGCEWSKPHGGGGLWSGNKEFRIVGKHGKRESVPFVKGREVGIVRTVLLEIGEVWEGETN